jgi:hypothetical protein
MMNNVADRKGEGEEKSILFASGYETNGYLAEDKHL